MLNSKTPVPFPRCYILCYFSIPRHPLYFWKTRFTIFEKQLLKAVNIFFKFIPYIVVFDWWILWKNINIDNKVSHPRFNVLIVSVFRLFFFLGHFFVKPLKIIQRKFSNFFSYRIGISSLEIWLGLVAEKIVEFRFTLKKISLWSCNISLMSVIQLFKPFW
jgi:hypothetical protein